MVNTKEKLLKGFRRYAKKDVGRLSFEFVAGAWHMLCFLEDRGIIGSGFKVVHEETEEKIVSKGKRV